MIHFIGKRLTALSLAGALALAVTTEVSAAPVSSGAALASALPNHATTDVRWRGRGWGWAGAGVAAGLAIGAIAASRPYYGPGYYGPAYAPGYAYGPAPVYVEEEPVYVAPPPVYAAPAQTYSEPSPAYGPRQCWVTRNADSGQGYWRPC